MTAANPPELTPTKNVHNQSMSIFMKESDIMTAANPPEFRPTNIWAQWNHDNLHEKET